jgi:tape measure domain-containing protein
VTAFANLVLTTESSGLVKGQDALNRFVQTSDKAEGSAKRLGETTGKAGAQASAALLGIESSAIKAAMALAKTLGAGLSVAAVVQMTNRYTQMTNSLKVLGLSGDEAAARLATIGEIAARTRSPLEATAQLYTRISMTAKELGASQADVLKFTEAVGNALAMQGGSAASASGALLQLSQAMGGGIVRAEEFNSILEGAYPIALAAAKGIDAAGGSVAKLRTLVIEGKISSEEFFNAIMSQSEALAASMAATSPTIASAFQVLTDQLTLTVGAFDAAVGASAAVAQAILFVAENLERLAFYTAAAATALAISMAPAFAAAAVAAGRFVIALVATRAALIRTGIGALVVLAGELAYQFSNLVERVGGFGAAISLLREVAAEVFERIGIAAGVIPLYIDKAVAKMTAIFYYGLHDMMRGFEKMLAGVASGLNSLFNLNLTTSPLMGTLADLNSAGNDAEEAAMTAGAGISAIWAEATAPLKSLEALNGLVETTEEVTTETTKAAGAMDKAGGAAKKAAEKVDEYVKALKGVAETAVDSFIDLIVSGFEGGMKSIVNIFRDTLAEMAKVAISRPIKVALGLEAATPGGVAAPGAGGGILGSIGLGISNFGTGFASGFGSFLTGGFGAIGTAIKGISTATSLLGGLGTALGAIAGPLAIVGALVSVFKTKTEILSNGLQLTVTDMNTVVETYELIKKSRFLGLSRSYSRDFDPASADVADPINRAVFEMQTNIIDMAKTLGIAASTFEGFSGTFLFSLKDLTEEQALAKIQQQIIGIGDKFAELAPGITALSKEGEGAATTIQRLATSLSAVNQMADVLGLTFEAVGLQGADAASKLVDAFGGLDAMSQATSAYYQAFYSEAERAEVAARQVSEALAEFGITMPTTRDAYRALVNAQDLSTESGRNLFAALVSMAGVMDQILPKIGSLSSALEGIVAGTQDSLAAALAANGRAMTQAEAAAKSWGDTERSLRDYLRDFRGSASELVSSASAQAFNETRMQRLMRGVRRGRLGAAGDITGVADSLIDSAASNAGSSAEAAVAQARVLAQVERAARLAGREKTDAERMIDVLIDQRGVLQELSDHLASGLPLDPALIEAIEEQLGNFTIPLEDLQTPINDLRTDLADLAEAVRAETAARLAAETTAASIAAAQERLEALVGQRGGVVGALQQAVQNTLAFDSKTGGRLGLNGGAAVLQVGADGRLQYQADAVYGATGSDLNVWRDKFWNDGGLEDQLWAADRGVGSIDRQIEAARQAIIALGGTPSFAGGGMHSGGLRFVGERGMELEATGSSRIYSAGQTVDMLRQAGRGDSALKEEVRMLRKAVDDLRDQSRQLDTQTLLAMRKLLRINEDWDNNGLPQERVE